MSVPIYSPLIIARSPDFMTGTGGRSSAFSNKDSSTKRARSLGHNHVASGDFEQKIVMTFVGTVPPQAFKRQRRVAQ
jgi:hypothetical protein